MDFRVLGPLEVHGAGGPLSLGGRRQRLLLAALVLRPDEVLSTDSLIDALWGEQPPVTAVHTLHAYVSRLRKVLHEESNGSGRLMSRPPGYLLRLDPGELDRERFERLAREGRAALAVGDPSDAATKLRSALALWRGAALGDLGSESFLRAEVERLEEQRLAVLEDRAEADLAVGRHAELVPELEALVAAHPLRERLCGQLMLALYRGGRQAEALAAYRDARAVLVAELGIEPGRRLQTLEQDILRHSDALDLEVPDLEPLVAVGAPARVPARPAVGTGWPTGPDETSGPAEESRPSRAAEPDERHRPRGLMLGASLLALVVVAATVLSGDRAVPSEVPLSLVGANAVAFVDPSGPGLLGQADAGGRPAGAAAGFGRLWVAVPTLGRLLVLDPGTHRVEDQVPVGRQPTGVAVDRDGVWVTDPATGEVFEVNPVSLGVVADVHVGTSPAAIAEGSGGLWVADARDGTLSQVDPDRAAVVGTVATGQPLSDVTVGLGAVWATSAASGLLLQVDPRDREVTAVVHVGNGPTSVRVLAGALWVANPPDSTVSRYDPSTGTVVKVAVPEPTALAAVGGRLWITSGGDRPTLTAVDPATGRVTVSGYLANPSAGLAALGDVLVLTTLAGPRSHRGGTLRVVAGNGVDSLDPGAAYSADAWQLLSMTNDGLLTYGRSPVAGAATLVPDLATALPVVQDGGRSFTFHLRPGIRYANGEPVRPEDFRRAVEREYRAGTGLAAVGVPIVGGERCGRVAVRCSLDQGVVVDDAAGTVTYRLASPDPAFLYQLALPFGAAVPDSAPAVGGASLTVPATGPYEVSAYQPGRSVLLVRNPRFQQWSATAQPVGFPDEITVQLGVAPGAAAAAVESGEADVMLDNPLPGAVDGLRRSPRVQVYTAALGETEAMVLDTRLAPFDRVAVRRAVSLAVDRARLVSLAGGPDVARPTCQVIPPGFPGYSPYCPSTRDPGPAGVWSGPDLPLARAMVARSGTAGTAVTVSTVASDPFKLEAGRYFVTLLDSLGYRARLRTYPDDHTYYERAGLAVSRTQVGFFGWAADYQAGSAFFQPLFTCAAYRPHQAFSMNVAGVCDPALDAEINAATALESVNTAAANQAWQQIDREVTRRAVWVPLVNPLAIHPVSSRVGNYQSDPAFGVPLDQLWVVG